jgi:hypothetical protein
MLKSTFVHIPGIGEGTELSLWKQGIGSWESFVDNHKSIRLSAEKKRTIYNYSRVSLQQLEQQNHEFFAGTLPLNLHWRAYGHFKPCYLDIETTGLSKEHNRITTIGIYDGQKSRVLIRGKDLDEFPELISQYGMIITFNGRCFDLPFISQQMGVQFSHLHIDLRFVLAQLGYRGGLKRIEKVLGITRDDEIEGVDGFEAVRLWHRYERGDQQALHKLVEYNKADIKNLKILMHKAYHMLAGSCIISRSGVSPMPSCQTAD